MVVMVVGFLTVLIQGTIQNGGPNNIWENANNGSRLAVFDFDVDPLRRHTFWTIAIGGTFTWLGIYGVNQSTIQRCISCKSEKQAKLALYLNLVGLWVILVCAVFSGLVMYAHFKNCDPWTAGFISAPDQLMPYFVMDIFSTMSGLPGLFVACAFSGTLSTVAASINALATVTFEDFVKYRFPNLSEKMSTWVSKGLCRYNQVRQTPVRNDLDQCFSKSGCRLFRESPWQSGLVCLPATSTDSADRSSHWPWFAVIGQWGLREAARAEGCASRPSRSPHWPGAVNHGQWEPQSAESADAAAKQTGPNRQGLSLNKRRTGFEKHWSR
uniref:Solute carrier family 5 member 12 n=1 Tax=Terrapene triunguis TaxID=2587831 RepID=A0A674HZ92_9SAUR